MKKSIFTSILIIFSIIVNTTFCSAWFLDDDGSLDLYKKIDEWTYKLKLKMTTLELKWWDANWNISDYINKKLKIDCLNLNETNIYSDKIEDVLKTCIDANWWQLPIEKVAFYMSKIKDLVSNAEKTAENKIKNLHQIARIGLYSDWNTWNSPFDLIEDIDEINKIIFSENIKYDWVNNYDSDNRLNSFLSWNLWADLINDALFGDNDDDSDNNLNNNTWNNSASSWTWVLSSDWSNYICKTNDSWLSDKELNNLIWTWTQNNYKVWDFVNYDRTNQTTDDAIALNFINNTLANFTWNYAWVNDNAFWPCNSFFCITIEFVTSMHKLLWGWKTTSIESLIARSNNHLKKFTATSLVQSRMTTNNFQLWLKDLKLPEIFHVWFQVTSKSPPILNIEGWKEKDTSKKSNIKWENVKEMLRNYFFTLWLDYKRENDLDVFKKKEEELKSLLGSTEMQLTESINKMSDLESKLEARKMMKDLWTKQVDSSIVMSDMNDFNNQFTELELFTRFLDESYSSRLKIIINKMLNKETWTK